VDGRNILVVAVVEGTAETPSAAIFLGRPTAKDQGKSVEEERER
jgi:hypothetical protein